MTCPTCDYYSAHGCALGLAQPCSRYTPGVEALEAWLRCECGGWVEVSYTVDSSVWRAWCTACLASHHGYRADPVAALLAFHEGRPK